jgi:hypothetical protein
MSDVNERDAQLAVAISLLQGRLKGDVEGGGSRTAVLVTSSVLDEVMSTLNKVRDALLAPTADPEPVPEKPPAKITMPVIKVNAYKLLSECVERGVSLGWQHAHKHVDAPTESWIKENIERDVMGEVAEYFSFDDVP